MHAPDGFLTAGTAVATGAVSAGTIGVALRQAKYHLKDKQVPLAGITAAFIFAAQMFNFPVAGGTTGHLMGGALAAVLLGPSIGAIVVTIVVVIQALAFADGGLTALGYNVFNMAIVTSFGGYAAFRLFRRSLARNATGVVAASGLAAGLSVVMAAVAFSIQWLFGASAPVPFDTVFGSMVGIHLLIGIGEGVISAMVVGAVLASRPDLVYGARDIEPRLRTERTPLTTRTVVIAGMLVAILLATVASQFAVDGPDGLEWVAEQAGFADAAREHAFTDVIFADYATAGVSNEPLSLAIAGIAGTLITLAVGWGMVYAVRDRRRHPPTEATA